VHHGVSPSKSDHRNGTLSIKNTPGATESTDQKVDALLVIRGKYTENMPCSRAALKNLAFSFIIDNSFKEKVEERLGCTFSLHESKGSKTGGSELDLLVKRLSGTENEEADKATRFLRAWAFRAMESTPCKVSTFLDSPEGLHIIGKTSTVMPKNGISGKRSGGPEITQPSFNASDLDLLLNEEAAKVCHSLFYERPDDSADFV
jgi:hypothetical protein